MNRSLRALGVLALATTLTGPAFGAPPVPPPAAETAAPMDGLVGRWTGSAVVTNTGGPTACRYVAPSSPPGVTLDIRRKGDGWSVKVTMDLPASADCPAIQASVEASGVVVSGRRIAFLGPEGHTFTLARRQERLQGIIAPGSSTSNLRLDGEVDVVLAPSEAPSRPAASARKGGISGKAVGAFVAVNVLAGAALVGANQFGKTAAEGGKVSCSPRNCIIPSPVDPCICNTTNITGGSCGTTTAGVGFNGVCDPNAGLPCETSLTCAGNVCESREGRCGF